MAYTDAVMIGVFGAGDPISKSGSALQECLNCLVLIVSPNAGAYDLYSCIGYQSDEKKKQSYITCG